MFHPQGPTFWELARQALSSTERGYDLLAPKFDFTPFRTPDEVLRPMAKALGDPKSIDDALDVCCGTGAAMEALRPLCRRRIVGIDFSQGMLDVARQRLGENKPGECAVELVRGDALDMPFENEFDLAITVGSLGHILPRDEPRFVAGIAKALRPGGRFALVTHEMPPLYSAGYWAARGFNAAMHVRNLLVRPPFIMFYLTFLLPRAKELLMMHDMDVEVREGLFSGPFRSLKLVVGTKRQSKPLWPVIPMPPTLRRLAQIGALLSLIGVGDLAAAEEHKASDAKGIVGTWRGGWPEEKQPIYEIVVTADSISGKNLKDGSNLGEGSYSPRRRQKNSRRNSD